MFDTIMAAVAVVSVVAVIAVLGLTLGTAKTEERAKRKRFWDPGGGRHE